ncbi:TonB-dependent receptor plug domain-containing protein [Salinimicrobium sediminilitoris]|uniref:TonB-dependent receptor plug domain-containing protein n=1 Tax=Salinimicrobium sediminilitoris TaxID=2876715 RepID=UPI001E49C2CD|nr:TonB-dependent receptor [Salinimicrobium sediminilitoris]MCC8359171.1 TonB-dependent receptor [Salinimicrobium sediminilitoris]
MMKKSVFYILFLVLLYSHPGYSQLDSINHLDEVVLSDVHLFRRSNSNTIQVLNDSVLEHNSPALTSILKFHSPIYFRENGPGMVASASFRGTTASQTAVIWNGININSQFTGQTDFNTILTSGYENIAIRSGGGSVLYGSGAIGGSVHLNDRFRFNNGFQNRAQIRYGSFDTYYGNLESEYSKENLSVQLSISKSGSENDFPYPGSNKLNENGDYSNTGINAAVAYLLNPSNSLKFYTNYYIGERGFSGTLTAPSKSKYEDLNSKNLLEWRSYVGNFTSTLRLAYLDEEYKYFENRNREEYSYGRSKSGIAKYELEYRLHYDKKLFALLEYRKTRGEGTNIEAIQERNTGSAGLLFSHDLYPFRYELSARTEFSDRYDSPLLFSAGASYAVTEDYLVKLNISRNYRIPTLNDLFWYAGGNLDLRPENSLQAEVGQELNFSNLKLTVTGFVINTEDLLRWVPTTNGMWRPENTQETLNYGLETTADWNKNFNGHLLKINSTYSFTKAVDQKTEMQLIYVPLHKATASAGYGFKRFSSYFQFLYNGEVYTSSDNKYSLDPYYIANAGVTYDLLRDHLEIGFEAQNIFNTSYQSMPSRPMPGRAYYSSLIFKF